ncbi:GNAT family N-acetyltransferase [Aureibacter tunicatorum]|uniref:GNAT superfamily N-acetyltransferase n=1 Tax=Aureibacter tunicatorum TaxID=866807 RepID=A0AAE3XQA2_9BACT|nr:GNAT family N-acetyltransferase [Aureibacter tunicatorum]MDR6240607.1 GNAT superfamily N-acetyltransferase [Aureibacter tunicatorum]BDD06532.1 hypothetical protein AUTU_40150 [Aureibacter tunicatorum]
MIIIHTRVLSDHQKSEILKLWNNEYPKKLAYKTMADFDSYLQNLQDSSHMIVVENDKIVGWYFDFIREEERWFAIIVDSKCQGKGFGSKLLNLVKEERSELNGWVIDHSDDLKRNGENYRTPLPFYLKNGFKELSDIRLELEILSAVKIRWKKDNTL